MVPLIRPSGTFSPRRRVVHYPVTQRRQTQDLSGKHKTISVICVICGYIHPRITRISRIRDGSPHPPFGHLLPEEKGGVLSRNPKAPNARPQRQTQNNLRNLRNLWIHFIRGFHGFHRLGVGAPHPPFGHLLPEEKGGVLSRNPKAPNARPQRQTQNKICVICVICGYVFCVICGYIWAHLP